MNFLDVVYFLIDKVREMFILVFQLVEIDGINIYNIILVSFSFGIIIKLFSKVVGLDLRFSIINLTKRSNGSTTDKQIEKYKK